MRRVSHFVIVIALSWDNIYVSAYLTVSPSNTVAVIDQPVTVINCSTSLPDPVDWWWIPTGSTKLIPIYQSATLVYLYDYHIEVKRGQDGQENLVIYNITFSDAGHYMCFEEGRLQTAVDRGDFASAELVVIDKHLDCTHNMSVDGVVGADICGLGLQPDYINITCSVRFSGNIPPTLSWSHDNSDVISQVTTNVVVPNLRITTTVIVQARERMEGSRFTCRARMIWPTSTNSTDQPLKMNWTSNSINTMRFWYNKTQAQSVPQTVCHPSILTTCSIRASPSILETCEYKWSHTTTHITVPSSTLNLQDFVTWRGSFVCTVTCRVRGLTCSVSPLQINSAMCPVNVQLNDSPLVTDVITANKVKNETIIAFVVSFVVLVVLVLVVLVPVVYFRKHIKLKIASIDHFLQNRSRTDRHEVSDPPSSYTTQGQFNSQYPLMSGKA